MEEQGQSIPGRTPHRAVTRSVTRGQCGVATEDTGPGTKAKTEGGRKRLARRLDAGGASSAEKTGCNNGGVSNNADDDVSADYCPSKFHGCSSSDSVQEVISSFGAKKLELVERMGLGGLQYLKRGFHNSRHLVFWLLKRMDVQRMELKLIDGTRIRMTLQSVANILGIRCSGKEVLIRASKGAEYVKRRLRERFGTEENKEYPELDDLRKVLFRKYPEGMSEYEEETFMIAFAGFCCAYMFGPARRTAGVPRDIWEFLAYPKKLLDCNWGGYVLTVLQSCARAVQLNMRSNPTSIKLGGCWLYLELLYMDSIDLGDNNIPLSWAPRIRWYDPKDLLEFTNHYEKCKGLKAKEAYLNRERRIISEEDKKQVPATKGVSYNQPRQHQTADEGPSEVPEQRSEHINLRPQNRLEELIGKINIGLGQVRTQLQTAAASAHEENRRNFEEQEQRINNLYGDVDVVVGKLNAHLEETIRAYVDQTERRGDSCSKPKVTKCKGEEGTTSSQKLDARGESANSAPSDSTFPADRVCSDKEDGTPSGAGGCVNAEQRDSFYHLSSMGTSGPRFDATPLCRASRTGSKIALEANTSTGSGRSGSKQEKPVYDATPRGAGEMGSARPEHDGKSEGKVATANALGERGEQNTRTVRIKMSATKPSMRKRKPSADSGSPSKKRSISKTTAHRTRIKHDSQTTTAAGSPGDLMALVQVCTTCATPIKRHVAQRQIPPSPFDLNLNPRTKCISVVEKRFRYFIEDESPDLDRNWFVHDTPWAIRLTGRQLRVAFADGGPIETEVVDAIVRLLQEEDTWMYKEAGCNERQWRHLLPPCFIDFIKGNGAVKDNTDNIKELFLGAHLETNAEHCRMIMLPSMLCGHWTLYAWDMEKRRINVLDPVLGKESREVQSAVHSRIIGDLHDKLFDCIFDLFTGLEDDRSSYKIVFYNLAHRSSKKCDAVFYVAHYIQWFDGAKLTFAINEVKARNVRLCMLYKLLHMEANAGWKPNYM